MTNREVLEMEFGAHPAATENETRTWTAAQVRRDLPDVPVKIGRKTYWAKVSGRLNPAATVTLSYITHAAPREHLRGRPWMDWHFSWEAVAHALTTGKPLAVD